MGSWQEENERRKRAPQVRAKEAVVLLESTFTQGKALLADPNGSSGAQAVWVEATRHFLGLALGADSPHLLPFQRANPGKPGLDLTQVVTQAQVEAVQSAIQELRCRAGQAPQITRSPDPIPDDEQCPTASRVSELLQALLASVPDAADRETLKAKIELANNAREESVSKTTTELAPFVHGPLRSQCIEWIGGAAMTQVREAALEIARAALAAGAQRDPLIDYLQAEYWRFVEARVSDRFSGTPLNLLASIGQHKLVSEISEKAKTAAKLLRPEIIVLASGLRQAGKTKESAVGSESRPSKIFIGHGRSPAWLELKGFLRDRLGLACDEFNNDSAAGITSIERLGEMLNAAVFAFIVMTAEDEQADGTKHARANVIHEAGLFQSRLGFSRAILLREEGCEMFSNVAGLTYIPFERGKLSAAFEEIRGVLEREGLIPKPSRP